MRTRGQFRECHGGHGNFCGQCPLGWTRSSSIRTDVSMRPRRCRGSGTWRRVLIEHRVNVRSELVRFDPSGERGWPTPAATNSRERDEMVRETARAVARDQEMTRLIKRRRFFATVVAKLTSGNRTARRRWWHACYPAALSLILRGLRARGVTDVPSKRRQQTRPPLPRLVARCGRRVVTAVGCGLVSADGVQPIPRGPPRRPRPARARPTR